MIKSACSSGVEGPRCSDAERARNARRVRTQIGGVELFVGRAPNAETAELFRGMIRKHRQEVRSG